MIDMATALSLAACAATGSAASLGAYNVHPDSVSVSGLSSGGFFAAQLGVAYSDLFKTGFGVFAGGPYDCARNQPVSISYPRMDSIDKAVLQLHVQWTPVHYQTDSPYGSLEWG